MADFIDINAAGGVTQAQVQAACEAAIAAANLPSAEQVAAAVVADPDLAALIELKSGEALDAKFPTLTRLETTVSSGVASTVVAGEPGKRVEVYAFEFNNNAGVGALQVLLYSGSTGGAILMQYSVAATLDPDIEVSYTAPLSESLLTVPRFVTEVGEGFVISNDGLSALKVFLAYRIV